MRLKTLTTVLGTMLACVTFAAPAAAQTAVKNPSGVEWTCPDHDADTQHELKILRIEGANKIIVTTILLGDPVYVDAATKLVRSGLNVQPIAFGDYIATMRVSVPVAGGSPAFSEDSVESNTFARVPGAPSKPIIK